MVVSLQLKQLLKSLKKLQYSHNNFTSKTHEQNVETILIENGFYLKNTESSKFYINQPNGSQKPPDFRVYHDSEYIDIECKSKKTGYKPMWNSSIPHKDTFYIFTNQKDNKTLIIEGHQIITSKLEETLHHYKNETKTLERKYNDILSNLSSIDNPYNIGVYARNMFVQNKHFEECNSE